MAIMTSMTRHGVAGVVGVNRGHRSFVTGVHRLQHVQRFGAAALADDDAVRTHTQTVLHQVALSHFSLAFHVHRPGFQTDHVRLLQLQFGGVFNRDDALVGGM
jgi:hypothetical protein